MASFKVYKFGTIPYDKALDLQLSLLEKRKLGEIEDTLLLLQHPTTFTIGRRGNMAHLLSTKNALEKRGIHFETISRGGDITFHGPGQLVGYPIIDLNALDRDIHVYLRNLEELIINSLKDFDIRARLVDGITGVWVKNHKIASIGVGVKRWITYHGFALNVNTDLSYFDMIVPCGIQNVQMTSIQRWLARQDEVDMVRVEESIIRSFSKVFEREHSKTVTVFEEDVDGVLDADWLFRIEERLGKESANV